MSSDDSEIAEIQTLPLDSWHRAKGGKMVPFAGYEMPIQYAKESGGGIVAEHDWTRSSASLFDVSHMGQLLVTGENAAEALEALVPGAITSLKPGRVRYTLLLNDDGGVLDDLMITNVTEWIEPEEDDDGNVVAEGHWGEPTYYLVVNGATKWDDIAHLREHLPDEVTLTHMDDQALIALQGPNAATALNRVMRGIPENLTFMQSMEHEFGEWKLRITRAGYTGEDGFEISVPAEHAEPLANRLCAEIEVRPAGLGARDSLRLEAGLPLYGHDLNDETDPVSAGLQFALSKKRRETGGYMGHQACAVKLKDGCASTRVGLVLEGRLPAREGALIYDGDTEVGRVTSGGFSPTLAHPVAMAYVGADYSGDGTKLQIEVRGKRLDATVAPMPFVPHRYHRGD
ncbi:glycine cleavage system aminomethyltransferase GcvT [Qipengyuania atrilutea]|uniref:aminomethyltransferase n=1 Tax=Qipengyuania atrilutea TaxID=2744473 RepID=A0A850H8F5_9SPHN|nr:glycine cleavage system aminomethyltransferase GcvT [Actirhodobacter atriluteus]NVD45535.1 glycine cleavage system aminomethyltransferase GcvT [Actirhodobacter atriluteus]